MCWRQAACCGVRLGKGWGRRPVSVYGISSEQTTHTDIVSGARPRACGPKQPVGSHSDSGRPSAPEIKARLPALLLLPCPAPQPTLASLWFSRSTVTLATVSNVTCINCDEEQIIGFKRFCTDGVRRPGEPTVLSPPMLETQWQIVFILFLVSPQRPLFSPHFTF